MVGMSALARTAARTVLRAFAALAITLIAGILPAQRSERTVQAASHAAAHTHATQAHGDAAAPECDHAPTEPCCHHANTCCVSLLCGTSTAPARTARTLEELSAAAPRFSANVHRRPPRGR